MTIDPRWSFYLSLSLAVLGFLSGAGGQFTDIGLDPIHVKALLALVALVIGVGNAVNAVFAAIPSSDRHTGFYLGPGPVNPPDPPKP